MECTQEDWADEQGRKLPIHGYEVRKWRRPDAFQFETVIHGRIPRVRYPIEDEDDTAEEDGPPGGSSGGVKTKGRPALAAVPWAERYSCFTLLFERFAIEVIQACNAAAGNQLDGAPADWSFKDSWTSCAGRWMDPHHARPTYYYIILRALAAWLEIPQNGSRYQRSEAQGQGHGSAAAGQPGFPG